MATGVSLLCLRLANKFVRSVPVTSNNMETNPNALYESESDYSEFISVLWRSEAKPQNSVFV